MTQRDTLLIAAMEYDHPEQIPVLVSLLPAVWLRYGEELRRLAEDYADLLGSYITYDYGMPDSYHAGEFTDAWGCVWQNLHEGCEAIVTGHPLPNREDVNRLSSPEENIGLPHGFMYLRLADLRGFEEIMVDFAEEPPELQKLIQIVLEYNVRQMARALENNSDPILFLGDDLGMQSALPMSPDKWRKYLKPCFTQLFQMAKQAGKYVYMHTDGHILEIMPDLQEAGADMINPQYRANGLPGLVDVCKGKIPICLDLDRQLFPFSTPDEIHAHVRECTQALYLPEGGLALNVEIAPDIPFENIQALLDAVRLAREYKG